MLIGGHSELVVEFSGAFLSFFKPLGFLNIKLLTRVKGNVIVSLYDSSLLHVSDKRDLQ
jgi:hypothetical protein